MAHSSLQSYFDARADERDYWKKRNWYYHKTLEDLVDFLVPDGETVLEIGSGTGELLSLLSPKHGVGIDISQKMIDIAKKKYQQYEWAVMDAEELALGERFSYIVASDLLGYLHDVESFFQRLRKISGEKSRIVITYYNYLWEPILLFAETLGLKAKQPRQHWLSDRDIENLLYLGGFEIVKRGKKMLFPAYLPFFSAFINRFIANLPVVNRLCLIQYAVARPIPHDVRDYSVSVVIPARNEKGNIEEAVRRLPQFGSYNEIIFIEGHSSDDTFGEIKRVAEKYAGKWNIRFAVQKGRGKGDAVRLGFSLAKGDILMILDADLTVPPEDLPKFYDAIRSGRGEFVNGSRLVYPMEKQAMRFLNVLGNKFFSTMFTWLLDQRIKDTLCGTKVLFKKDYEKIAASRSYFGDFDPFGDFDLLFGAAKMNLKIVEMPIRYKARTYGATNIDRWKHGLLLLKMTAFAMRKIKFI